MDEDTPIEASQVIHGEVVKTKAAAAYELKLEGKSLSEISDELGYASGYEVSQAIYTHMRREANYLSIQDRNSILQMELDRLDRLQAKVWPSAMTGDPKSVEAALKVIDRRIKIAGLDAADAAEQQHQILIVGGEEKSYIEKLKELAGG